MRAEVLTPSLTTDWLPSFLATLPESRAHSVFEQLEAAFTNAAEDSLVMIVVRRDSSMSALNPRSSGEVMAAAIVLHPRPEWPQRYTEMGIPRVSSSGQSASVLHAGALDLAHSSDQVRAIEILGQQIDQTLRGRGVRFLNWATDLDATGVQAHRWPTVLGFDRIADLDYYGLPVKTDPGDATGSSAAGGDVGAAGDCADGRKTKSSIQLCRLDWTNGWQTLNAFMESLQRSLQGTLDCPRLTDYYSLSDIFAAYQSSPAFSPDLWFIVESSDDPNRSQPLGVVMLAMHGRSETLDWSPEQQSVRSAERVPVVAEMIYLGVLPDARGRGVGSMVLDEVIGIARQHEAQHLVLAVDQQNQYAIRIYQKYGMQAVRSDSVWIKTLDQAEEEARSRG